ncbi:MAG TPA: endonuclease/exonuclease/phosphatase family protein [Chitinophagales bacterium]|nr:endonuclease/exonuclease/phosphatase family protein [Chitinophagales bacterium]
MKFILVLSILFAGLLNMQFSPSSSHHDKHATHQSLCIAFYNVENLFDTKDDPNVDDEEFTPNGKQHWTLDKYAKKISNIAKVIRAMKNGDGADVVGFAEIENKGVLEDLIADPQLKKLNYGIAHHDSPDKRGIDVAMIYKKNIFKVLGQKFFTVDVSKYEDKPTRDIVMVQGVIGKNDTLNIFLNHWPSRREGKEVSEPKRIAAATVLKRVVDSLQRINPWANILIMGDFNDNPTDKSVSEILKATNSINASSGIPLYDCDSKFDWKKGEGTEFYKGSWSRFIQIIVNSSLISKQVNMDGTFTDAHIFKPDWLLKEDETSHQMIPHRTFEEGDSTIGFSDHLPVYIEIKN